MSVEKICPEVVQWRQCMVREGAKLEATIASIIFALVDNAIKSDFGVTDEAIVEGEED